MDQPQSAASTSGSLQAKGSKTEPAGAIRPGAIRPGAIRERVGAGDLGGGQLKKPVGAVGAAEKGLPFLDGGERPLNASGAPRAPSLHRGTTYNILRTLQAEGFV